MNDFRPTKANDDQLGCIGNYDAHNKFCRQACALSLSCLIEHNRSLRLEQLAELFDWEDVEPVNTQ